jgi:hypothetical protein
MHRRLALALAITLSLTAATTVRAQTKLDFVLVNRTGYQIDELYVGPTTSRSWGDDILGEDSLPDKQSVDISFDRNAATCNWDIKVVYNDGDVSEFRNANLCRISRVMLFWNRQAGTTRFTTE